MVGASGAIFGLFGIMIGYGTRQKSSLGNDIRRRYLQLVIFGLVMGFFFGYDNYAHLGGLAGGFLFGYLVNDRALSEGAATAWKILSYLCWFVIFGSLVLVALSAAVMIRG